MRAIGAVGACASHALLRPLTGQQVSAPCEGESKPGRRGQASSRHALEPGADGALIQVRMHILQYMHIHACESTTIRPDACACAWRVAAPCMHVFSLHQAVQALDTGSAPLCILLGPFIRPTIMLAGTRRPAGRCCCLAGRQAVATSRHRMKCRPPITCRPPASHHMASARAKAGGQRQHLRPWHPSPLNITPHDIAASLPKLGTWPGHRGRGQGITLRMHTEHASLRACCLHTLHSLSHRRALEALRTHRCTRHRSHVSRGSTVTRGACSAARVYCFGFFQASRTRRSMAPVSTGCAVLAGPGTSLAGRCP